MTHDQDTWGMGIRGNDFSKGIMNKGNEETEFMRERE